MVVYYIRREIFLKYAKIGVEKYIVVTTAQWFFYGANIIAPSLLVFHLAYSWESIYKFLNATTYIYKSRNNNNNKIKRFRFSVLKYRF